MIPEILTHLMIPVVAAIGAAAKSIRFIHEGEKGVRLRFGKAERDKDKKIRVREPGFILMVPFVDTLRRHHVRQQSQTFNNQRIVLKDGLVYTISAVLIYRVTDVTKALFEIDNLDSSLQDLSTSMLREVIQNKNHTELFEAERINEELAAKVKDKAAEWGVEIIKFGMTDCAPTQETASIINAEIGVKMRLKALKDALGEQYGKTDPVLAAVLVGIPAVASISNSVTTHHTTVQKSDESHEES